MPVGTSRYDFYGANRTERESRVHRRYSVSLVLGSTSIGRIERVQSCSVDGAGAVNGTNREQRFWERVDRATPRLGQMALKHFLPIHLGSCRSPRKSAN
jgi:hypothetical protein